MDQDAAARIQAAGYRQTGQATQKGSWEAKAQVRTSIRLYFSLPIIYRRAATYILRCCLRTYLLLIISYNVNRYVGSEVGFIYKL